MDIEAKFLFEENLWAEVEVQVINSQPLSFKDSQSAVQRAGSILKHAGMFEHTKRKSYKGNQPFFNFVKNGSLFLKPADSLVTTRGAGSQVPMVLGQAKGKKEMRSYYVYSKKKAT